MNSDKMFKKENYGKNKIRSFIKLLIYSGQVKTLFKSFKPNKTKSNIFNN